MDATDAILSLLETAIRDGLSRHSIVGRAEDLAHNAERQDVEELIQGVLTGDVEPFVLSVLGFICATILSEMGLEANAGRIQLNVANDLSERSNIESLRIALEHYDASRTLLPCDDTDIGASFVNEAITRQTLAELGSDSRQNLSRALTLLGEGHVFFDPGSNQYSLTLMNKGNVYLTLSQLGDKPSENLRSALKCYRQARFSLWRAPQILIQEL